MPGDRVQVDVCKIASAIYQDTAIDEFWPTINPRSADVRERLVEWQHFWNSERTHSALGGKFQLRYPLYLRWWHWR